MDILIALALGAIQGLTEFLPISSAGHFALAKLVLGADVDSVTIETFEILVRLACALGIIIYFAPDFRDLFTKHRRQLLYFMLASVPVFVMEAVFSSNIAAAKMKALVIGIGFLGTGIFLMGGEVFVVKKDEDEPVKLFDSLLIGLAQAVALLPGVSRTGATIGSGLICGVGRTKAVKFALMLGVPAILGSVAWKLVVFTPNVMSMSFAALSLGALVAFGLTFLAIPLTIKIVQRGKLYLFSIYCFLIGLSVIIYTLYQGGVFKGFLTLFTGGNA
jgi:undecaprenyl-diphosphatase